MNQTIFITGTSTGLGKFTAIHFAKQGWKVIATMRNPKGFEDFRAYENIKVVALDVRDVDQVKSVVTQAIAEHGPIDVVLNNAGVGVYGALELVDEDAIDWQYAVNVRGPINVIRAFIPHFRERKSGRFINVGSFMGTTTFLPLGSLYNMSKFALEGLTEGLYYELKPLGIDVHLIEPGGSSDNNFKGNMRFFSDSEGGPYHELSRKVQNMMGADPKSLDSTQTIVEVVADLAQGKSKAFRTVIGQFGNELMKQRRDLPIEEYLVKNLARFLPA